MVQGAKSLKGVQGNLRFIVSYKFWATVIVFAAGVAIGAAISGGVALAQPDESAAEATGEHFAAEFDAALDRADADFDRIILAHSGGMSPKDNCHRHKKAKERHWHIEGSTKRGGPCVKAPDGKTIRLTEHALCGAERAAFARDKSDGYGVNWQGHAEALKECIVRLRDFTRRR